MQYCLAKQKFSLIDDVLTHWTIQQKTAVTCLGVGGECLKIITPWMGYMKDWMKNAQIPFWF